MEEIRTRKVPFTSKPNQEYLKETYGNRMEDISGLLMQDESYGGYDLPGQTEVSRFPTDFLKKVADATDYDRREKRGYKDRFGFDYMPHKRLVKTNQQLLDILKPPSLVGEEEYLNRATSLKEKQMLIQMLRDAISND